MSLQSEIERLLKNSAWVFGVNVYKFSLSFVRSIVIARLLGVSSYGEFVVVMSVVGLVYEFLSLNLPTTLTKFGTEHLEANKLAGFRLVLNVCMLLTLASAVLSVILALASIELNWVPVSDSIWKPALYFYVFSFVFPYLSGLYTAALRLYDKFRLSSLLFALFSSFELILLSVALLIWPKNVNSVIIALSASNLLSNLVLIIWTEKVLAIKKVPFRIGLQLGPYWAEIVRVLPFSLHNSLSRTIKTIIDQGDVIFLGYFVSFEQIGLYSIAKKLSMIVFYAIDPLITAVFPQFNKLLAEKKFKLVLQMVNKAMLIIAALLLVYLVLAFYFGQWAIVLMFGSEFKAAYLMFMVFNVAIVFNAIVFWHLPVTWAIGASKQRLYTYLFSFLLVVILVFPMVKWYGVEGMALVQSLSKTLMAIILAFWVYKRLWYDKQTVFE